MVIPLSTYNVQVESNIWIIINKSVTILIKANGYVCKPQLSVRF